MAGLQDLMPAPTYSTDATGGDGSLVKGLRAGWEGVKSQTHQLLGQAGEGLGADQFAADQRAQSVANQQAAAADSQGAVQHFSDVHGLRDFGNWGMYNLGAMAPTVAAGAAGALAARYFPGGVSAEGAVLGNAAGMAPGMIGEQLQAQQNDPEQAKKPWLDRTLTAGVGGGLQSLVTAAAPGTIESKFLAPAVEGVAKTATPFLEGLAHNVPGAVAGNAAAMAASTEIGHQAASHLNPNRDASNDLEEDKQAAIEGGAMGAPFGVLGAAGDMRGAKAEPKPGEAASGSITSKVFGNGKDGAVSKSSGVPVALDKPAVPAPDDLGTSESAPLGARMDAATKVFTPPAPPDLAAAAEGKPPEEAMMAMDQLQADIKAKDDATNAAMARRRAERAPKNLPADEPPLPDELPPDVSMSMMSTNAPEGAAADDAKTLAAFVAKAKAGKVEPWRVQDVADMLQDNGKPPTALVHMYGEMEPGEGKDNFLTAVNQVMKAASDKKTLTDSLTGMLKDKDVQPGYVNQLIPYLKSYFNDDLTRGLNPAESKMLTEHIDNVMRDTFNDPRQVSDLFESEKGSEISDEGSSVTGAAKSESELSDAPGVDPGASFDATDPEYTNYYGQGKDKANPQYMLSDEAHKAEYGDATRSTASDVAAQAAAAHPDAAIGWVSATDHARENGVPATKLNAQTKGKPENYGLVTAKGRTSRDAFTADDVQNMKLDTDKYPNSDSRMEVKGGDGKTLNLDAKRIAGVIQRKMGHSDVSESVGDPAQARNEKLHALRDNFHAGVAALSDRLGARIEPSDSTVVAKGVTYGDLKNLPALERPDMGSELDKADATGKTAKEPMSNAEQRRAISTLDVEASNHQANVSKVQKKLGMSDAEIKTTVEAVKKVSAAKGLGPKAAAEAKHWLNEVTARMKAAGFKGADAYDLGWEKVNADQKSASADRIQAGADARAETARFEAVKSGDPQRVKPADWAPDFQGGDQIKEAGEPGLGRTEIDPNDDNIHLADKEHGDDLGRVSAAVRGIDAADAVPNHAIADKARGLDKNGEVNALGKSLVETKINSLGVGAKSASDRAVIAQARGLLKNWDKMPPKDQAKLYSELKDTKRIEAVGGTIDGLTKSLDASQNKLAKSNAALAAEGKPRVFPKTEAQVAKAFRDTVKTDAGRDATLERVKASTDAKSLQSAVSRLVDKKGWERDANTKQVVDALNTKISDLIAHDPDQLIGMDPAKQALAGEWKADASKSDTAIGTGRITDAQKAEVAKIINDRLGPLVSRMFSSTMKHAGEFTPQLADGLARAGIKVSVFAKDPGSVALHESMHALFDHMRKMGMKEVNDALAKTASSPSVRGQLRELLKDEPAAWKQCQDSAEERAAYMYQFHEAGKLKVGGEVKGIFQRIGDFIKRTLGIWTSDERAVQIMKYFSSGDVVRNIGDRSAVHNALIRAGRNESLHHIGEAMKPMYNLGQRVLGIGSQGIRDMNIDPLTKMVDLTGQHANRTGEDRGFIPTYTQKARDTMNQLAASLSKFSDADKKAAWAQMQTREKGQVDTPEHAEIKAILRKTLTDVYDGMTKAGVKIGFIKDHTPVQWDAAYIAGHQPEFLKMAAEAIRREGFDGTPQSIMNHLMRNDGNELGIQDVRPDTKPGNVFAKERVFKHFTAAERAPFLIDDPMRVMSSYVHQGIKRAEWAARFDDDNGKINAARQQAILKHGATDEQIKQFDNYMNGVNGSLGSELSPKARRLMSGLMVANNLRVLGLGWFSGMVDPIGIKVRGGTWGDAASAYKDGIFKIAKNLITDSKPDAKDKFAEDMGVIENAMLGHAVQSAYGVTGLGNWSRRVNDMLFKYNLMEQQGRNMRAGAAVAAAKFIARHNDGYNGHSARYMEELGLKKGEAVVKNGELVTDADELREHFKTQGISGDALEAKVDTQVAKMKMAVNTWVDGAVVRPDATKKATWMNDPYFALMAHMKSYTYAFHDTILKRVAHEAAHGNNQPLVALGAYVPVMFAADMMKAYIIGGGSMPAYQQNWDTGDWLAHETSRAGLLSTGQYAADEFNGIRSHGQCTRA